ncbi:ATP-binding protein [Streptacidiphilus sp. 4-A2]|nr:ATP-binding protein [Streptacidiphilus sp. 4-A2]
MMTQFVLWHAAYPSEPESIARVRRDLRSAMRGTGFGDEVTDDVVLLASEMATNAVRHGRGSEVPDIGVRLVAAVAGLYLEVTDGSRRMPQPRTSRDSDVDGRGLLLLAELGHRWGVTVNSGVGKHTWVLVAAPLPEQSRPTGPAACRSEPTKTGGASAREFALPASPERELLLRKVDQPNGLRIGVGPRLHADDP